MSCGTQKVAERNGENHMSKVVKDIDRCVEDDELENVTGGLNGGYADVTIQNSEHELENVKRKGQCGDE